MAEGNEESKETVGQAEPSPQRGLTEDAACLGQEGYPRPQLLGDDYPCGLL